MRDEIEPREATQRNFTMKWRLTREPDASDRERYARIRPALTPFLMDHTHYVATDTVIEAVNTALSLGKPLLVTGDPGVGKTRLAYYIAWRLGLWDARDAGRPEVHRFDVKSTAEGQHLLYHYDAIRHFRESRLSEESAVRREIAVADYVELEALGRGIALACSAADLAALQPEARTVVDRALEATAEPRLAVVLIDEIDKAPRDVPNDLLRELDEMSFKIPELGAGAEIKSTSGIRPFVIITSNEEKSLPDPFLRRCCFLHLAYPEAEMQDIIGRQIAPDWGQAGIALETLALVKSLRDPNTGLRKKPGVAETLEFLRELQAREVDPDSSLAKVAKLDELALVVFGNDRTDQERIRKAIRHVDNNRQAT